MWNIVLYSKRFLTVATIPSVSQIYCNMTHIYVSVDVCPSVLC